MSNRKNKNSKTNQTTGNSHNDFNSFRSCQLFGSAMPESKFLFLIINFNHYKIVYILNNERKNN